MIILLLPLGLFTLIAGVRIAISERKEGKIQGMAAAAAAAGGLTAKTGMTSLKNFPTRKAKKGEIELATAIAHALANTICYASPFFVASLLLRHTLT